MLVPFAEWTPDLPSYGNPGANIAKNVIPAGIHYEQLPGLTIYSNALTARPQGAFAGRDIDGTVYNFAGDATKLYKRSAATYSDVSRLAGGAYSTGTDEQWNFTQFGRNVYATNFNDVIQSFTMGSSANFAALAGSPPQARYLAIVKNDFLVLANLSTATYRVQWSPQGNPAGTWGTDPATLADSQDLSSEWGYIRQIVGGEYGTIFQERAITRMTFVGSPLAFVFDQLETNKGTQAPGSVCKIGNAIFYLGLDGFYMFNGQSSEPIGANKIDKTFFADLDQNYMDRIRTVSDQRKMLVYLSYPGSGNVGGRPNKLLIFNYSPNAQRRWTQAEIDTEVLCASIADGYTLDSLDSLSGSIDALTASLDSEIYTGGQFSLAAFDSNNKLNYFNGNALTATIETTEVQPNTGGRTELIEARPIIEGNSSTVITLTPLHRTKLTDSYTTDSTISLNTSGTFPMRTNDMFHRLRLSIAGGFTNASGIDVLKASKTGHR